MPTGRTAQKAQKRGCDGHRRGAKDLLRRSGRRRRGVSGALATGLALEYGAERAQNEQKRGSAAVWLRGLWRGLWRFRVGLGLLALLLALVLHLGAIGFRLGDVLGDHRRGVHGPAAITVLVAEIAVWLAVGSGD